MSSPSILDTAEYRKLALIAAGVDPSNIPAILDTATWRHLMLAALYAISSGGGGGGYISGVVDTYNDLPVTVGTPAINTVYLVRFASGIWLINRKPGGLYIRIANFGTLDDWEYLSAFPEVQSDLRWRVYNETDPTKEVALDVSNVSTGTLRTLTVPNASGRIQIEGQPIGNVTPAAGTFTNLAATPTSGSALTLTGGTVTASAPLIDATQTWNDAAVTFRALRVNVTNTNSATTSLLADFQVGGTTQFSIRRDGASLGNYYRFTNLDAGLWVHSVGGQEVAFGSSPNHWYTITSTRLRLSGDISLGRSGSLGQAVDCILVRDDAGVLAQRNAANAQTFRLYNTFTDASNYERGFMRWSSNVLQIGTEKLGSGTARSLNFDIDGVTMLVLQAGGSILANRSIATTGGYGITSDLHFTLQAATGQLRWGSTSSVPMLKRSSTTLQVRLGDDSAFAPFEASTFSNYNLFTNSTNFERGFFRWSSNVLQIGTEKLGTGTARALEFQTDGLTRLTISAGGSIIHGISNGVFGWTTSTLLRPVSGNGTLVLYNNAQTDFNRLQFGGTDANFPALKRSSTALQVRLADDSAYSVLDAQLRAQGTAPATSGAAGTAGDIRYDTDYIYVCTAASTWKRAAIATW